ncbi:alpha/beta hydrolase [Streptomyces pseudovenezuelae]|uniref:alpha/beta hydrolase n=1 Tax=Streptomyces pseudovenezuelae TaxID=67350 RepID=UPI002E31B516|nr:alpha/beta hydrolase [Streptomyces pseudovenezuelae]
MSQKLGALTNGFTPQTVEFPSGDGTVVAHLYLPQNHDASKRYPAVAIGGSFSSVKEQMSGIYAGEMARRDVIGLAIDYRNYGESSGTVRQYEDPKSKAADMSAALRFLESRSDVSGAGLLGVCTSGTTVIEAAAYDQSVRSVAAVAGAYFEPGLIPHADRRREEGRVAREKYEKTGAADTIPAYHPYSRKAVNTVPMPYYLSSKRGNVPTWRNEFAVMAWADMLSADAVANASKVTAPTLMIHSKAASYPGQARKVHQALAGPKELFWGKGQHFSFYDHPAQVHRTADRLSAHFKATLS